MDRNHISDFMLFKLELDCNFIILDNDATGLSGLTLNSLVPSGLILSSLVPSGLILSSLILSSLVLKGHLKF